MRNKLIIFFTILCLLIPMSVFAEESLFVDEARSSYNFKEYEWRNWDGYNSADTTIPAQCKTTYNVAEFDYNAWYQKKAEYIASQPSMFVYPDGTPWDNSATGAQCMLYLPGMQRLLAAGTFEQMWNLADGRMVVSMYTTLSPAYPDGKWGIGPKFDDDGRTHTVSGDNITIQLNGNAIDGKHTPELFMSIWGNSSLSIIGNAQLLNYPNANVVNCDAGFVNVSKSSALYLDAIYAYDNYKDGRGCVVWTDQESQLALNNVRIEGNTSNYGASVYIGANAKLYIMEHCIIHNNKGEHADDTGVSTSADGCYIHYDATINDYYRVNGAADLDNLSYVCIRDNKMSEHVLAYVDSPDVPEYFHIQNNARKLERKGTEDWILNGSGSNAWDSYDWINTGDIHADGITNFDLSTWDQKQWVTDNYNRLTNSNIVYSESGSITPPEGSTHEAELWLPGYHRRIAYGSFSDCWAVRPKRCLIVLRKGISSGYDEDSRREMFIWGSSRDPNGVPTVNNGEMITVEFKGDMSGRDIMSQAFKVKSGGKLTLRGNGSSGIWGCRSTAVECEPDSQLYVYNQKIINNRGSTGSAIYADGAQVWLRKATITNNKTYWKGAGILLFRSQLTLCESNIISNNTCESKDSEDRNVFDRGVYFADAASYIVASKDFHDNSVSVFAEYADEPIVMHQFDVDDCADLFCSGEFYSIKTKPNGDKFDYYIVAPKEPISIKDNTKLFVSNGKEWIQVGTLTAQRTFYNDAVRDHLSISECEQIINNWLVDGETFSYEDLYLKQNYTYTKLTEVASDHLVLPLSNWHNVYWMPHGTGTYENGRVEVRIMRLNGTETRILNTYDHPYSTSLPWDRMIKWTVTADIKPGHYYTNEYNLEWTNLTCNVIIQEAVDPLATFANPIATLVNDKLKRELLAIDSDYDLLSVDGVKCFCIKQSVLSNLCQQLDLTYDTSYIGMITVDNGLQPLQEFGDYFVIPWGNGSPFGNNRSQIVICSNIVEEFTGLNSVPRELGWYTFTIQDLVGENYPDKYTDYSCVTYVPYLKSYNRTLPVRALFDWKCTNDAADITVDPNGFVVNVDVASMDRPVQIFSGNEDSIPINAHYYANTNKVAMDDDNLKVDTSATTTNELIVINTEGGFLPQSGNGEFGNTTPNERHKLYVNVDSGMLEKRTEPMQISNQRLYAYPNIKTVGDIAAAYRSSSRKLLGVKVVDKDEVITVTSGWKYAADFGVTDLSEVRLTTLPNDPGTLHVTDDCHVILLYDPVPDEPLVVPTDFYDYDITSGVWYDNDSNVVEQIGGIPTSQQGTNRVRTYNYMSGINSLENYSGVGAKYAFGNSNTASGLAYQLFAGNLLNMANFPRPTTDRPNVAGTYKGCTFGLVSSLDENGNIIWTQGVDAPDIFNENTKGVTKIPGHNLIFTHTGDTYTLESVSGTSVNNLSKFNNPNSRGTPYKHIWTNNFWPADSFPTYGADGHDIRFGSYPNYAKRTYYGKNGYGDKDMWSTYADSDDGLDHNSFFGMNFAVSFSLPLNYQAPLDFTFFGDDDLWVFLDGRLICDIGGVHSSVGEYVDLWDYLNKGNSSWHTLEVFFTERGASGSTCFIEFTLPNVTPTRSNLESTKGALLVEKAALNTSDDREYVFEIELKNGDLPYVEDVEILYTDQSATVGTATHVGNGLYTFTLHSGDKVLLRNLPPGITYTLSEQAYGCDTQFLDSNGNSLGASVTGQVYQNTILDFVCVNDFGLGEGLVMPDTGGTGNVYYIMFGMLLMLIGACLFRKMRY